MTEGRAQDLVNGSALVVSAIYFYRKLIEPAVGGSAGASAGSKTTPPAAGNVQVSLREPETVAGAAAQLMGQGQVASTGRFVVGWGVTFLVLSLLAPLSPKLAGSFAGLVALGSILGNGTQVSNDIVTQLRRQPHSSTQSAAAAYPTTTVAFAGHPEVGGAMPQRTAKPTRRHKPAKLQVESV